jgi:hypothetical protein
VVQPGTSPLRPVIPPPPPPAAPPPPPVPAGAASLGVSAILGIILAIPLILLTQEGTSDGTVHKQKPRQKCSRRGELDPPWRERDKWPRRCQLDTQTPQPLLNRELCLYRCKGDQVSWAVPAYAPLGGKCPKWLDWLPPGRILDPNNLPPDAIP